MGRAAPRCRPRRRRVLGRPGDGSRPARVARLRPRDTRQAPGVPRKTGRDSPLLRAPGSFGTRIASGEAARPPEVAAATRRPPRALRCPGTSSKRTTAVERLAGRTTVKSTALRRRVRRRGHHPLAEGTDGHAKFFSETSVEGKVGARPDGGQPNDRRTGSNPGAPRLVRGSALTGAPGTSHVGAAAQPAPPDASATGWTTARLPGSRGPRSGSVTTRCFGTGRGRTPGRMAGAAGEPAGRQAACFGTAPTAERRSHPRARRQRRVNAGPSGPGSIRPAPPESTDRQRKAETRAVGAPVALAARVSAPGVARGNGRTPAGCQGFGPGSRTGGRPGSRRPADQPTPTRHAASAAGRGRAGGTVA